MLLAGGVIRLLELSLPEARRLMIGAQLLSGPAPKRPSKTGMRDVIRHLGAVQIDSISVVQRSHHIVLWSRLGSHPTRWLDELLAEDRAIFEYWVHAAAYAPIEHFPYFRRDMLAFPEGAGIRTREWVEENPDILNFVLDHIRENGPVTTKSFAAPDGAERAAAWAWYGNKPTNVALDMLWSAGKLMIDRRDKFQRVYDLTERILPEWNDAHIPSLDAEREALGLAALNALGVTTARWLPDYFRTDWGHSSIKRSVATQVLNHLLDAGLAVEARVEGIDDPAFVSSAALERRFRPSRTTLLSSFDSLVWDRRRTKAIFDFDLMLEAYTPREKRVYGYFSLPILYRDQLVGRLDPKAHRKTGEFAIHALHLEPWFVGRDDERFYAELAATLIDFSNFNGTDHVTVARTDPPHAFGRLNAALEEHESTHKKTVDS
jgi:uncharacterized protein